MRSFALPETRFELVRSEPGADDGHHVGEPTGEVRCACCGAQHQNLDRIGHVPGCPQSDVHSQWWAMAMASD